MLTFCPGCSFPLIHGAACPICSQVGRSKVAQEEGIPAHPCTICGEEALYHLPYCLKCVKHGLLAHIDTRQSLLFSLYENEIALSKASGLALDRGGPWRCTCGKKFLFSEGLGAHILEMGLVEEHRLPAPKVLSPLDKYREWVEEGNEPETLPTRPSVRARIPTPKPEKKGKLGKLSRRI